MPGPLTMQKALYAGEMAVISPGILSGIIFEHQQFSSLNYIIMENISMPSDHSELRFLDQDGNRHEGIYSKVLRAFVDTEGGKDPEDINNIYQEDKIVDWEYLHKRKNLDSDTMIIL